MPTPMDIVTTIYGIASQIYDSVQQAKANHEQCQRLADRVRILSKSVEGLVAQLPHELLRTPFEYTPEWSLGGMIQDALGTAPQAIVMPVLWQGGHDVASSHDYASVHAFRTPHGRYTQGPNAVFVDALLDLKAILENALTLAKGFVDKSWLHRVVRGGAHKEAFDAISVSLSEGIQQLSLALNVYIKQQVDAQSTGNAQRHVEIASALPALQRSISQVMTTLMTDIAVQQTDRDAAEKDRQQLLNNQALIINQNMELKYDVRALSKEEADRHGILAQQLSSMQETLLQALGQMPKAGKSPISEKLLIPFHRLIIDKHIATGGFGKILLGRWSGQTVVIKVMEGHFTEQERDGFIKEVSLLKRMRSDYVMGIYAVCYEAGRLAYVMKHMAHGSLQQYLEAHSLTSHQYYRLALQIALGLKYLHTLGIIHRNLKTANILLDEHLYARITDFGYATQANLASTLGERNLDIQWSAPEILRGTHAPHKGSEIYSLGLILWSLVTRKIPFADLSNTALIKQAESKTLVLAPIPENVPLIYRELIGMCTATDPVARPRIDYVVNILQQLVVEQTLAAEAGANNASPSSSSTQGALSAEDWYAMGFGYEALHELPKAVQSYEKVASVYPKAKTNLGMFFSKGEGGKPLDPKHAFTLFLDAAQQGHPRAMHNVARCYRLGFGTDSDAKKAAYWAGQESKALAEASSTVSSSSGRPAFGK